MMTRKSLLASLDAGRVEAAIREAEHQSAIELRVSIAGLFLGDAQHVAERAFRRLGMTATRRRNGLLLFVAPWRRKIVVVADEGITSKVDPNSWGGIVTALARDFRVGHFTEGLVAAIRAAGQILSVDFPPAPGHLNELPDTLDRHRGD